MNKIVRLRREALASCNARGHTMSIFTHRIYGDSAMANCMICGMKVYINANPPANGIDIHGEAVAIHCKGAE